MDLPSFNCVPSESPIASLLSQWLRAENPFEPEDRPETMDEFAELVGVEVRKVINLRWSKGFREFHSSQTHQLDEQARRHREMLDGLYRAGLAGSVSAMTSYIKFTEKAQSAADAGRVDPTRLSVADAAAITDEDLNRLLDTNKE